MVDVEVVGFPADGGPSEGQFHSAELGAVIAAANGYGVYASTITATITGASRVITFPAFDAFVPDGAGTGVGVAFAGGTATPDAGGADPRTDIIVLEDDGSLTVVAGVATALSSSVVEAPMPAVPSNSILLMKVPLAAGQGSFVDADALHGRAVDVTNTTPTTYALFPYAPAPIQIIDAQGTQQFNSNTSARVTAIQIPFKITVTNVRMSVTAVGTAGTAAFGLFSSDGQTRHFSGATASISGTGIVTTALGSAVTLEPGLYYFMVVVQSTADLTFRIYTLQDPATSAAPAGANEPSGTVTVTAGTIPATFDPDGDVTFAVAGAPRLMIY